MADREKERLRFLLTRIIKSLVPAMIDQLIFVHEVDGETIELPPLPYQLHRFTIDEPSGVERIDRRLASTRECFQLVCKGETVHESWLRQDVRLPRRFGFDASCPVVGDSQTPAAHRGKGYFPMVLKGIVRHCRDAGRGRVYVLVSPTNKASIRSIEKSGFRRLSRLRAYRLGGLLLWKRREPAQATGENE